MTTVTMVKTETPTMVQYECSDCGAVFMNHKYFEEDRPSISTAKSRATEHVLFHKYEKNNMDTPSVGRIVHYYDKRGEGPFAAIVIGVHGDKVDLTVFKLTGQFVIEKTTHGNKEPGTWTWPTRHGAS